jgi:hypothetical protein
MRIVTISTLSVGCRDEVSYSMSGVQYSVWYVIWMHHITKSAATNITAIIIIIYVQSYTLGVFISISICILPTTVHGRDYRYYLINKETEGSIRKHGTFSKLIQLGRNTARIRI